MAYEHSRALSTLVGALDTGTVSSTPNIDTAFTFEASGDAFAIKFTAPVSQSSATLTFYAFCTAVTGTPDFQVEVREGYGGTGDIDRPKTGGADIGSSSSTVSSPSANTWLTWTVTCSLTAGDVYWVLVKNTHGTPASNHATFAYRGSIDSFSGYGVATGGTLLLLTGGYTLDGFATDPSTNAFGFGTAVLKFSTGDLLGFPYVATTAHASDTNYRGIRVSFTEDTVISGVVFGYGSTVTTGMTIYSGGSTVLTETGDPTALGGRPVFRFAPTTLSGGVSYDVVMSFSVASTQGTYYTMGQDEGSVPTDVKNCRPSWLGGSVDSATSSFTPDTSRLLILTLIIDNFPAISGGGGIRMAGRGGLASGR